MRATTSLLFSHVQRRAELPRILQEEILSTMSFLKRLTASEKFRRNFSPPKKAVQSSITFNLTLVQSLFDRRMLIN